MNFKYTNSSIPNKTFLDYEAFTLTKVRYLTFSLFNLELSSGTWRIAPAPNNGYYLYNPGEFEFTITKGSGEGK